MQLLSTSDAAKISGFSASQIRRLIRKGLIKAKKVGFFYLIEKDDIKNLKRRRKLSRKLFQKTK